MNFSKINEIKPQDLNCNVFDVYSYDGLSMQELLCQFFTKINECIKTSNKTIDLAEWLVNEGLKIEVVKKLMLWLEDGTLENLINVNLFNTLHTKIENIKSQLDHIPNKNINVTNYENLVNDGDWTDAINKALDDCEKTKCNLYFPNGFYSVKKTINLRNRVSIIGQSRLDTQIYSSDCTIFNIEGESILKPNSKGHIQQTNIKNITLNGVDLNSPTLTTKACSRMTFENVFFYGNNGSLITSVECFDVRWIDCLFEWGGTSDGEYPLIDFKSELGYEHNNNHYFYGCLFESYRGKVIKNIAENSTEFKFTDCKFESSFSNSCQFEFENVGVIHFNNCMVSAQGSDLNANVSEIISFKNCYDIKMDISMYKWDDRNGNRDKYYLPTQLIKIDSCYCFDFNVRIFNNSIRLKDDNNPYIKLINSPNDGSNIRVIKRPGDAHRTVEWFTQSLNNNISIKNPYEPTISLTNQNNVTYQLGRLGDDNKFKIVRYESNGNEVTPFVIENKNTSINGTLFLFESLHLSKLSDDSEVEWWDNGTMYYNTTTNQLRIYKNGRWENVTTTV